MKPYVTRQLGIKNKTKNTTTKNNNTKTKYLKTKIKYKKSEELHKITRNCSINWTQTSKLFLFIVSLFVITWKGAFILTICAGFLLSD